MTNQTILIALVLFPFLGAFLSFLVGRCNKTARDIFVIAVAFMELFLMGFLAISMVNSSAIVIKTGEEMRFEVEEVLYASVPGICGMGLYFELDGFRIIYGLVASFMWAMTALFSKEYFKHYRNRNRYYLFYLMTLGATMGVFLSADLFTTFIFFEIMSFASYVWVAQDERKESLRAAETYLEVAVIGGMVLLMGLFLLYHCLGTLRMDDLLVQAAAFENKKLLYFAGVCAFVGFGAKAGAFPLHIWLPKAHPVAPAPASALLSGILTKSGIFGLLVVGSNIFLRDANWGMFILAIGTITMVGGAVLAIFSIDLKRTLACSSMSQIGFILVGLGIMSMPFAESGLAIHGALLHMVNHSLLKLILFMAAGVVYMNLHKLDLNEIRGFGRKKPFLHVVFLLGAYGLMCLPFGNGYVSKTLLHEGIVEWLEAGNEGFKYIEYLFLFSGGCTIAYMLKLYFCLFIEKNEDAAKQAKYDAMGASYMNLGSRIALMASAVLVPILGLIPSKTMSPLATLGEGMMHPLEEIEALHFYTWNCLKGSFISIIIGVVVYVVVVRLLLMKHGKHAEEYVNRWPAWLDLENLLYRPFIENVMRNTGILLATIPDTLIDGLVVLLRKTVYRDCKLPYERLEGTFLTDFVGALFDHNRDENHIPLSHKLATAEYEVDQIYGVVRRSISFGLVLFCIGLVCTLIYMIVLL